MVRAGAGPAGVSGIKGKDLERATGIEPVSSAWKAEVLPLHNARALTACIFHGVWGVKTGDAGLAVGAAAATLGGWNC